MPKNKLIYFGVLLVAAAALLFLGYYLFTKAMPVMISVATIGVILIIVGLVVEAQKRKEPDEGKPENPNV